MLTNKIAVVTGGSKGIGRAISIKLANLGATVIINYNGSKEAALETKTFIESKGGKAFVYQANIGDFQLCKEFVSNIIKEHGALDILVNNAGITRDGLVIKMSEEAFDDVITTNLKGTFNTIRFASRQMSKQGFGRIVNISSIAGLVGNPGQVNYSASKAGVIGITKSAAKELAKKNITVNAVAPGFIETDMTDVLTEEVKESILNNVPLKRTGKPEDIANAVGFLVTEGSYITGQVITVDGGMTI
ncbi:MAG: 3-oxoacyl-[acyl-carrier-protein] reductase [Anaerovoracaceae bacterium]